MTYKWNGKVCTKKIETMNDVKEFAELAIKCQQRYNDYCEAHPSAVMNNTMKNYKSLWRKANDLFYEAYYELDDNAPKTTPVEFIADLIITEGPATRSLKDLYPEKYEALKHSEKYKIVRDLQLEANKAKKICKADAQNVCMICGVTSGKPDAHHIIPLEDGGSNDQDNLICLCRKCHQQVHKGVYIINPNTREITVGKMDHIDPDDKPEYVKEFEKKLNIEIYKNTGRYYSFINGVKTQFTAAEMKEAVGYNPASVERKMSAEKRQSIKERKILEQYKQMFKEAGNKSMWHQMCRVISAWDKLESLQKEHVFEVLHNMFSKYDITEPQF